MVNKLKTKMAEPHRSPDKSAELGFCPTLGNIIFILFVLTLSLSLLISCSKIHNQDKFRTAYREIPLYKFKNNFIDHRTFREILKSPNVDSLYDFLSNTYYIDSSIIAVVSPYDPRYSILDYSTDLEDTSRITYIILDFNDNYIKTLFNIELGEGTHGVWIDWNRIDSAVGPVYTLEIINNKYKTEKRLLLR
jgi:hypothetical protein